MDLLFNNHKQGQEEIVKALGFLSSDFNYLRLRTNLILETPKLIEFLGKSVYNKLIKVYKTLPKLVADEDEYEYNVYSYDKEKLSPEQTQLIDVIELAQVYVATISYLKYAPSNDLMHTTEGRKMTKHEGETTPWDWQIASNNAALKKQSFTTLDAIIRALNESGLDEWKKSDAYKKSKSLFVYSTAIFNDKYPIDNSEQLYFRLVPLMSDIEELEIHSRIGAELFNRLKASINPPKTFEPLTIDEKKILVVIQEIIVYATLVKAYKIFPIEMFPDKVNHNTKATTSTEQMVRESVVISLEKELKYKYSQLEKKSNQSKNIETYEPRDFTPGLKEETNHVDL